MNFIYTLGILLHKLIIWIASAFNVKAKKWIVGRKNTWEKIQSIQWVSKDIFWFHCASLGEFEQGRPLLEKLKNKYPHSQILLTFFSPSGYEVRKHYKLADCVCYLPIDTKRNAKKLYELIPIKTAFLIKYEFWANYIFIAKQHNTKIYSIATLLRKKQHFFKPWGKYFRTILRSIDYFFVQDKVTKHLLSSIQINKHLIVGDPRFDRVYENATNRYKNKILEQFKTKKTLIIGSSWQEDEKILFPMINKETFVDKVIIAPHEVSEKRIREIEKSLNKPNQRYTKIIDGETLNEKTQILIIDCIGILANSYYYSDYSYIGGAFGKGLHNILEPATFGLPVIFGTNFSKFPEAKLFIKNGIGFSVNNTNELEKILDKIKHNYTEISKNCFNLVKENIGATNKIISKLKL